MAVSLCLSSAVAAIFALHIEQVWCESCCRNNYQQNRQSESSCTFQRLF